MAKHDTLHEPAPEPAPAPDPKDPHMARGDFMQSLHALVNQYAEHWDEHRDPKATEPATEKAWLADFEKYLTKHSSQP